jgi:hypothetical protein
LWHFLIVSLTGDILYNFWNFCLPWYCCRTAVPLYRSYLFALFFGPQW